MIAIVTTTSLLVASLAATGVKVLFDRPRPPLADVGISAVGALPSTPSFPSGHAATAFGAAVALALLVPRLRWWAIGLATLVALSRVYLGMHFTADVAAGALLGTAIAGATVVAARRLPLLPNRG
jgi:undecaprenyl-diphosphatase